MLLTCNKGLGFRRRRHVICWQLRGMTCKASPCPLAMQQKVVHFGFFELVSVCEFPTQLRVVGAGFTKSNRLHEESGLSSLQQM